MPGSGLSKATAVVRCNLGFAGLLELLNLSLDAVRILDKSQADLVGDVTGGIDENAAGVVPIFLQISLGDREVRDILVIHGLCFGREPAPPDNYPFVGERIDVGAGCIEAQTPDRE